MATSRLPTTVEEFQARIDEASVGGSTSDDQSRTWDGQVLNGKEAVMAFVAELAEARRVGRVLGPSLDE